MKASSTAINRFRCQALDADEEGSVQATGVPPELNQTVHTVAAVGIGVDVLGAGCQNGSGVYRRVDDVAIRDRAFWVRFRIPAGRWGVHPLPWTAGRQPVARPCSGSCRRTSIASESPATGA